MLDQQFTFWASKPIDFSWCLFQARNKYRIDRIRKVDIEVFRPHWQVDDIVLHSQQRLHKCWLVVISEQVFLLLDLPLIGYVAVGICVDDLVANKLFFLLTPSMFTYEINY